MRNIDIINNWVWDAAHGNRPKAVKTKSGALIVKTYGDRMTIYSYGDHFPLARFEDGHMKINDRRTSQTTTRLRNMLIKACSKHGVWLRMTEALAA